MDDGRQAVTAREDTAIGAKSAGNILFLMTGQHRVDHFGCRPGDPDDEFPRGDDWQFCDFLRRLGLHYPGPDDLPYDPDWQADE